MNNLPIQIAAQTKNSAFKLSNVKEFLNLLKRQKKQYSDISYQGNGAFALVLKAKKNNISQVALKVIEYDNGTAGIETIEKEYNILRSLTRSDYFVQIYDQFYLTEENDSEDEQNQEPMKRFYVQELELCSETLSDLIEKFRQNKQEIPENLKETLSIQMLDALNLLHSRFVIHRDIKPQNFLVSSNKMFPIVLKLCDLGFASPASLSLSKSSISGKGTSKYLAPETENNKSYIESDLFALALVLLQLDNILTFDYNKVTNIEFYDLYKGKIFKNYQLNRSSFLYKIATTFLQYQPAQRESAQKMLLSLVKKSVEYQKIPLFSLLWKSQIDSFKVVEGDQKQIPYKISEKQQNLPTSDLIMINILNQINKKEQNKRQLTTELIKGALKVMMQWNEFGEEYELLGSGAMGIVFGVENLKQKRKSVLKLQLCLNKSEAIREIGIMRICQTPYIVEFYGYNFFSDAKGNQFIVYELERCKYSLKHYLELQKIDGEYSKEQKYSLVQQIIDSVNFLHKNKILHGDLKLDNFMVTENKEGQIFVKLIDFDQAGTLMNEQNEEQHYDYLIDGILLETKNSIINKNKRGTLLYYSPEKWQNGNPQTYQADSFALGLILIIIDNYLVFSEDQLLKCFCSFTQPYVDLVGEKKIKINTETDIFNIAKGLLSFRMNERDKISNKVQQLRQTIPLYSKIQEFPMEKNSLQQYKCLNLERINKDEIIICQEYLKKAIYLSSISLNLFDNKIGDIDAKLLLSPLSNLSNLSSVSLNLNNNKIGDIGAQLMLSPLRNLSNLACISLNLDNNNIEDIGAQSLLSCLNNLYNLSSISLNLNNNKIGDIGAQSLLSPLKNLSNLTNIKLGFNNNKIGEIGAQQLLFPLNNLNNLSSISISLNNNKIGDIGVQQFLIPLSNLNNLICIQFDLENNNFGDIGAESLLSPFSNLKNLSSISLGINNNKIGDIGVISLLSPLSNLSNLVSITLDLCNNKIGAIGAKSLLSPLSNLSNLVSISLDLNNNNIGGIGAQTLLSPLSNLRYLASISLLLNNNQIGDVGAQLLLSPLRNLNNLSNISLNLNNNKIGEIGAQSLLSPLSDLSYLANISIDFLNNKIEDIGAQSFLSPLSNLSNLTSIQLRLNNNNIGEIGAQTLLSPLCNLSNLASIALSLNINNVGDIGALTLLSPLSNLSNLSGVSLNLCDTQIGEIGAQQLLSPLSNLNNLTSIQLRLNNNNIGEIGAQTLLSPLCNLSNLVSLSLSLNRNCIGKIGAQSLLFPLSNLSNLASISLHLEYNQIGEIGAKSLLSPLNNLSNLAKISLNIDSQFKALIGSHFKNLKINY